MVSLEGETEGSVVTFVFGTGVGEICFFPISIPAKTNPAPKKTAINTKGTTLKIFFIGTDLETGGMFCCSIISSILYIVTQPTKI